MKLILKTRVFRRFRSSRPEVFLAKGVLKICSIFTGKCWGVISIKLLCNFNETTLRHGCSPVNLLHIFATYFPRNASGWLLLHIFKRLNLSTKKQPPEMFYKKVVLRNFPKFKWKHLRQSLFFNKVTKACNFITKETLAQVFSCEFCGISKNTFSTKHLWVTASVYLSTFCLSLSLSGFLV